MVVSERVSLLIIPVGSDPLLVAPLLEAEGLRDRCAVKGVFIYEDGESFVGALQAALTDRSPAGPMGCAYTVMRLLERSLWEGAAGCSDQRLRYHWIGGRSA